LIVASQKLNDYIWLVAEGMMLISKASSNAHQVTQLVLAKQWSVATVSTTLEFRYLIGKYISVIILCSGTSGKKVTLSNDSGKSLNSSLFSSNHSPYKY